MKKTIISMLAVAALAACALSLLTSCAKTDEALTVDSENLVQLSSSIEGLTRVSGQSWESTDAIGVTIFKRGEDFPSGDDVNIKYVPEAAGASVDFNAAEADKALYFPHKYGTMDFIAYYPYGADVNLSAYTLDGENTEVLFAFTEDAVKGKPVALQFKSPYSQIKVNLESSDGSIKSFDGAQITLKDVVIQGAYDILSSESNLGKEIQDLTYDASASGYILPQDFTPSFEISLGGELGNYKVAASEQLQAKANTIYSYTVDITLTGIKISGSIEDLVEKDMGDMDVEQVGYFMLADLVDGFKVPASINTWVIDDEDATADDESDFAGLRAAVDAAVQDDDTRKIKLVFPNLTKIPDYAFQESKIQSISAPKMTSIGEAAFSYCDALQTLKIGYDESVGHATVSSIDPGCFGSAEDTKETTLYIGLWSVVDSDFSISGNTLTLSNGTEQVFSQIIQAE